MQFSIKSVIINIGKHLNYLSFFLVIQYVPTKEGSNNKFDYSVLIPIVEILSNKDAVAHTWSEAFVKMCGDDEDYDYHTMLLDYFLKDLVSEEPACDSENNLYQLGFSVEIDLRNRRHCT